MDKIGMVGNSWGMMPNSWGARGQEAGKLISPQIHAKNEVLVNSCGGKADPPPTDGHIDLHA